MILKAQKQSLKNELFENHDLELKFGKKKI